MRARFHPTASTGSGRHPAVIGSTGRGRLATAVLALVAVVALVGGPALAADSDPNVVASPIRVTAVDATTAEVELSVIGAPVDTTADAVHVTADGDGLAITGVGSAAAQNRPVELALVVDADGRGISDNVLETIKTQLAAEVAKLPAPVSVAVIAAGDGALVRSTLTPDHDKAIEAIQSIEARNGSALYKGLERASALFSSDPGVVRSVLVVSTGADVSSKTTVEAAEVGLVSHGIQIVSLRYNGGDKALAAAATRSAGTDLAVKSPADLPAGITAAMGQSADRLLVSFTGKAASGERANLHLDVGQAATDLSYPAGTRTEGALQLRVEDTTQPTGFAFFRSSIGLYVSLVLAFAGISLGIWSLGSMMAGGDSTLEGLLSRYADGRGEVSEDEVEELIVQSALLKRAINFGEAFAEKRGFLVRAEDLLEKADLPVRAGEAMFMLAAITVFTGLFGLLLTRSFVAGILLAIFAVGMSFFVVKFLGRRRFKKFESLLPDTLQLLSGTLRAGYSLPQGMEVVSREIADPMGVELRRAMTEARLGRELEECLGNVAERMGSPDFAWAVMAIGIQREVGGNLNELLTSVADTMIARDRLRREVSALTAEGRMSAGILSFLPPGLGLVMWIMNPGYISVLFTELIGNIFLGLGTVSALVGLAWMKKVITIDV